MNTTTSPKRWEKTRLQNLVRHKSGRYYARLFLNGKEIWKSLKTSNFSVAESRLADAQKEHRVRRGSTIASSNAKMTFEQAAELHLQNLDQRVNLKRRTRSYWRELLTSLKRSWPELGEAEIRRITPAACRTWAAGFAKGASATRYNNTAALLRHILQIAVESGFVLTNPALGLERKPVRAKKLELPTLAQFDAFIAEMHRGGGRDSSNCADLAAGLAFTGCRISEARQIKWADVDFDNAEITVRGDPDEATKNSEIRRVPMIPGARKLFEQLRAQRQGDAPTDKVFLVSVCRTSMDRAAKKIGMARITHHDLRHLFATVCIESGVDIPTVSRWLGHKDGGALAMRTYGHLRREHSRSQALRVSFNPKEAA